MKKQRVSTLIVLATMMLLPQFSFAELATEPLLPTGNLSLSDTSFAPYKMKTDQKRVYFDLWSFNGNSEYDSGIEYELNGIEFAVGYDYKTTTGYLSVGYDQSSYLQESTKWKSRTDGYKREYDVSAKDVAVGYIHELDEGTIGILALNKSKTVKRTASLDDGNYFVDSGKNTDKGSVDFAYIAFVAFTRIEIDPKMAVGILFAPAVNQTKRYDDDFEDIEYLEGHGMYLDVALGYQTKQYTWQALMHSELEQAATLDGNTLSLGLSGEYLLADNVSAEGGLTLGMIDEVEDGGSKRPKANYQSMAIGFNYRADDITFSADISRYTEKDEDYESETMTYMISILYGF